MRSADLTPPQKRLLRHVGRIEPKATILNPGEYDTAQSLHFDGLIQVEMSPLGKTATITDTGREALR